MGRALRIEGAGLWYHVMCRGKGGRRIFNGEKDYLAFLARVGMVAAGYHLEIHAYTLMPIFYTCGPPRRRRNED